MRIRFTVLAALNPPYRCLIHILWVVAAVPACVLLIDGSPPVLELIGWHSLSSITDLPGLLLSSPFEEFNLFLLSLCIFCKGIKLQVSKWNELKLSHKYHQIPRRDDLEIFCENDPHQSIWLRLLEKALAATPADLPHGRDGPGHGGGMITKGLVRGEAVSLPEAVIPAAAPSTMSSHAPPGGQPQVQAFQAGGGVKEIMDKV